MNKLSFYYFSGTGNAKRVAEWFLSQSKLYSIEGQMYDIIKSNKPGIPQNDELIGFISPTHGFNFPPVFIEFLLHFPKAANHNRVFIMNTRGGMKLWKIFLPGYSGIALWLASLILLLKGYRIVALRSIDLPSNWQSLHPGLRSKVVNSMFVHYEPQVRQFADKILTGKRVFKPSMILSFFIDIPIIPISLGYYLLGRFILAKTFMASYKCDNCGLCYKNCPVKAISLVQNRPFWSYKCESCMRCMENCPKRAIETAHGFLALVLFLTFTISMSFIYYVMPAFKFMENDTIFAGLLRITVESVICFVLLIAAYRIMHYLKRYLWFDVLITYTSFTKLWFWRRYKAPKLIK